MARLGVIAVGQPRYFWDAGDAWLAAFDPDRAHRLQPFREMIAAGVRSPFRATRRSRRTGPWTRSPPRCCDRRSPGAAVGADQALSVEEAVRACTADAAASYFADDRLGTLEVGKLADVVVLDRDLFATPADGSQDVAVDADARGRRRRLLVRPNSPASAERRAERDERQHLVGQVRGEERRLAGRVVGRDDLDDVEPDEVDPGEPPDDRQRVVR